LDLQEALEFIVAGRALLFTGAGFSRGAVNLRNTPFKAGGAFAAHLAQLSGLPENTPLDDAAEWFTNKHSKSRMVEELQEEFTVRQVSQGQIDILRYPWKRIYTTNYDNVAETAAVQSGKKLTPATLSDTLHALPKTGTLCIHLNGFIDRLKVPSLDSEIKLTDTSYLTNIVAESPWATTLRQDMGAARAVFFIGYSTADIDIRRLLYDRPELKEKSFFVIGPQDDQVAVQKISRFGTITGLDLDGLVSALAVTASSHTSEDDQTPINYCVRQFEPQSNPPAFEDRLMFDLLLHGDIRPAYALQSLHGQLDYFVDSPAAVTALSCFNSGHRAVALYSDLGNGKTAAFEALKVKAFDTGYDVYSVVHNSDTLIEELQVIFRSSRKTLLMIEQYADWLDVIAFIGKNAPAHCVLALSARSSTHDLLVDRIGELLKPGTLVEIPVDKLQPQQCVRISDLFDQYGLWADLAAKSKNFKLRHLDTTCHAEWHAILIDRFNAPQIHGRFTPVIESLSKKKRFYEVVTTVLVLNVLEYNPSVDLLLDLCGQAVLEKEFKDDPSVREIIDASSGRIRLRSSVAGRYVLTNFADPNGLVSVLTKMAKAADANARNSKYHFELLKDLTKFNGLQYVFPEKDRRKACIRYYESIKDLYYTKKNPLFWLQYAIACTLFEEFDRAEKYFDTAYALAEARNFDSFQIDNHYARFLLMRAIATKDQSNCMKSFRDARKLIFEQVQTERRHYPFRVATSLAEFFDTFVAVLSPANKQEIARAAKYIFDRIEALPKDRQDQRYVMDCRQAMLHVLELAPAI
jgi:hypothetical protein